MTRRRSARPGGRSRADRDRDLQRLRSGRPDVRGGTGVHLDQRGQRGGNERDLGHVHADHHRDLPGDRDLQRRRQLHGLGLRLRGSGRGRRREQGAAADRHQVAPTPIALGAFFHDTATLGPAPAGAPAPTGTVTFNVYGPGDPTCAAAPVFTSTNAVNAPGTSATSSNFTPAATGTYRVIATYSGDANYLAPRRPAPIRPRPRS